MLATNSKLPTKVDHMKQLREGTKLWFISQPTPHPEPWSGPSDQGTNQMQLAHPHMPPSDCPGSREAIKALTCTQYAAGQAVGPTCLVLQRQTVCC
jgi:hypothetical protein